MDYYIRLKINKIVILFCLFVFLSCMVVHRKEMKIDNPILLKAYPDTINITTTENSFLVKLELRNTSNQSIALFRINESPSMIIGPVLLPSIGVGYDGLSASIHDKKGELQIVEFPPIPKVEIELNQDKQNKKVVSEINQVKKPEWYKNLEKEIPYLDSLIINRLQMYQDSRTIIKSGEKITIDSRISIDRYNLKEDVYKMYIYYHIGSNILEDIAIFDTIVDTTNMFIGTLKSNPVILNITSNK